MSIKARARSTFNSLRRGTAARRARDLLAGPHRMELSEHLAELARQLPPPQAHNNPQLGSQEGKL